MLDQYINSIESNLALVEECDTSICEGMQDAVADAEVETALESTGAYRFTIFGKLAKLKLKREELLKAQILPSPLVVNNKVVKLPLPPIQITSFENNLIIPLSISILRKLLVMP